MALARAGIALDQIVIQRYYAVGVCRRSALRLVLAEASLGYAVIGDGIVLTTKEIADSLGNSVSERPTVSGLTHNDVTVRRNNTFAAGNCRLSLNEFLAPLISGLKDADRDVRFNSAYAIAGFGSDARDAVHDLIAILIGDDFTLREVAKYSLSQIGQPAISPLLAAAEDLDPKNSEFAVMTLGDMGITGRAATEGLIGVATRHITAEPQIHDDDCAQCRAIAMAVAQVSTVGDRNSIRQLLSSKSPGERAFASYVVGDLGSSGMSYGVGDLDSSGMSFKEISSESVERELEELLLDQTITVRRAAARALANLDLQLETAMQLLETASQDADDEVRIWAREALRKLKAK